MTYLGMLWPSAVILLGFALVSTWHPELTLRERLTDLWDSLTRSTPQSPFGPCRIPGRPVDGEALDDEMFAAFAEMWAAYTADVTAPEPDYPAATQEDL